MNRLSICGKNKPSNISIKGGIILDNNQSFQVQYANPNITSAVTQNVNPDYVAPRLDILEDEDNIIYELELPGINSESLNVEMDKSNLFVRAEINNNKQKYKYLHQERINNSYYRQISVPINIDPEHLTADYQNGILTIKFPKNKNALNKREETQ